MAKIIGQIGPLTRLLDIFMENGIDRFQTLDEIDILLIIIQILLVTHFRKLNNLTQEIINLKSEALALESDYNHKITQREALLSEELKNINSLIHAVSQPQRNILKNLYSKYKLHFLKKRKSTLENNFDNEKVNPFIPLQRKIEDFNKRNNYLENNFDTVAAERYKSIENKYLLAKSILKDHYSLLLGAIGEQKAVNELSKLPDSYFIINDFQLLFFRPIFHKASNSYIKSIQADHIVIGPSGIFLIETKNWSKDSTINKDLYSPIEQIKRTNHALFFYLNNPDNYRSFTLQHAWGQRKITVRNILLMINNKPAQEFQYVKILTLNELIGYIQYFKPVFSNSEIQTLYKELSYDL